MRPLKHWNEGTFFFLMWCGMTLLMLWAVTR